MLVNVRSECFCHNSIAMIHLKYRYLKVLSESICHLNSSSALLTLHPAVSFLEIKSTVLVTAARTINIILLHSNPSLYEQIHSSKTTSLQAPKAFPTIHKTMITNICSVFKREMVN